MRLWPPFLQTSVNFFSIVKDITPKSCLAFLQIGWKGVLGEGDEIALKSLAFLLEKERMSLYPTNMVQDSSFELPKHRSWVFTSQRIMLMVFKRCIAVPFVTKYLSWLDILKIKNVSKIRKCFCSQFYKFHHRDSGMEVGDIFGILFLIQITLN